MAKKKRLDSKGAKFVLHGMLKVLDRIDDEVLSGAVLKAHYRSAKDHIKVLITLIGD